MPDKYGQWRLTAYDLRSEHAREIGSITLTGYRAEIENLLISMRSDLPQGYGASLVLELNRNAAPGQ